MNRKKPSAPRRSACSAWRLETLKAAMEKFGVERSGEMAAGMGHGLVLTDDTGPVFLATKSEALA